MTKFNFSLDLEKTKICTFTVAINKPLSYNKQYSEHVYSYKQTTLYKETIIQRWPYYSMVSSSMQLEANLVLKSTCSG